MTDLEIGEGVEDEITLQPLLLHSLSELREVWRPILEVAGVRSATEIGSESGVTSHLLIELLHAAGGGRLTIVDPGALEVPAPDDVEREIVRGFSPGALKGLPCSDVYLVDGDHNYWTVSHELAAIAEAATGRDDLSRRSSQRRELAGRAPRSVLRTRPAATGRGAPALVRVGRRARRAGIAAVRISR